MLSLLAESEDRGEEDELGVLNLLNNLPTSVEEDDLPTLAGVEGDAMAERERERERGGPARGVE